MSLLGEVWDEAVGVYEWLKSLTLGEFAEDRPTSVIVTDMLMAMTVPGAVIVTSARDLAAVSLRLGKRYESESTDAQNAAHPEWQEWVILIASALGVFGPVICAGVGSLAGAMVGDEAAAVIRAVCLLLIDKGGEVLEKVAGFLARFTNGNIVRLLQKIHFADYGESLVTKLKEFLQGIQALIGKVQGLLSHVKYIGRAQALLEQLEQMEKRFYAVQVHCVKQIPRALSKLDEALQTLLKDKLPPTYHPAYAGVPAHLPEVTAPKTVRVSSGIGKPPKLLPMKRDGMEAAGGGALLEPHEPTPCSSNVHRDDVAKMSRAQKGIFGEKVSDDFMTGRGYQSELSENRQMRLLEQQPTGRGIDGVYRKPPGEPPPPYVVTETKFRTGGKFDADGLPKTKGSRGYPSATQMSDGWIRPRIARAVNSDATADMIKDEGYEAWLMVVDENGKVTSITKLDESGKALQDSAGKPVTVPVN